MEKKKETRFRILKNKLGEYKPEIKDWIFWFSLSDHNGFGKVITFDTYEEAENCAVDYLEREDKRKLKEDWRVVSKLK